ncbi:MAG TPA: bifunctional DNA-formamidopyrimidine glycosylase/DNA-(apurinic or apyrimidinic site) lyase [Caldilineae bacterium]|nr:bifunctional DNA-formamidopyrimidine glycosylase/DNA-(apurinic or apyrimidinic site) lyase [Caldilineae bacterium]
MPELPEVQTILEALAPSILEQPIDDVSVLWPGVIDRPPPSVFVDWMRGRRVVNINRRGKYMLFGLDDERTLVMHLRMTGEMRMTPAAEPYHKHDRLAFHLANGRDWRFKDMRKFGRAYLVEDPEEVIWKLGPEPLSAAFSADYLAARLRGRTAPIKSLLLDQRLVAGIGNIYADESLFRARIHPLREGGSLRMVEISALVGATRDVIQQALAEMGTTLRDYRRPDGSVGEFQNSLQVFRRTGEPCPSCGTPISRIVVGGRSTHFCANEQTLT